jgi:hypothetical protein
LYFPKRKQSSNHNADPVSDGSWLYSVCITVFVHSENVVILFAHRIELTAWIQVISAYLNKAVAAESASLDWHLVQINVKL